MFNLPSSEGKNGTVEHTYIILANFFLFCYFNFWIYLKLVNCHFDVGYVGVLIKKFKMIKTKNNLAFCIEA